MRLPPACCAVLCCAVLSSTVFTRRRRWSGCVLHTVLRPAYCAGAVPTLPVLVDISIKSNSIMADSGQLNTLNTAVVCLPRFTVGGLATTPQKGRHLQMVGRSSFFTMARTCTIASTAGTQRAGTCPSTTLFLVISRILLGPSSRSPTR